VCDTAAGCAQIFCTAAALQTRAPLVELGRLRCWTRCIRRLATEQRAVVEGPSRCHLAPIALKASDAPVLPPSAFLARARPWLDLFTLTLHEPAQARRLRPTTWTGHAHAHEFPPPAFSRVSRSPCINRRRLFNPCRRIGAALWTVGYAFRNGRYMR
jgi:hypothetical protein